MAAASCPERAKLEQLLLGRLSSREARQVEQHLLRCSHCCSLAEQLTAGDELLVALRRRGDSARVVPSLQRVIQRVKNLTRRPTDTDASRQEETHLPQSRAQQSQSIASQYPDEFALLAPPQQPGEVGRLGHYRVLGVIGSGGMGVVFQAQDTQLQRSVALKVMKPALARNPRAKERFLREARAMAAVEHECIVPVYQVGEEGGVPFIAMPLLRGRSLQDHLKQKRRLPPAQAVAIARQVAAALSAAHIRRLIHRDIKPANIWLEDNGRVRLLDFGLARPLDTDAEITHAGSVVGTPYYMAPEQARGEKLDHRCDLFSLGAVLYHMLSGRRPFQGKTLATVLAAVMQQEPPPLDSVVQGLPRELVRLVHRLLAKNPRQRPQSAAEVYEELLLLEEDMSASSVRRREPSPPPLPAGSAPSPWEVQTPSGTGGGPTIASRVAEPLRTAQTIRSPRRVEPLHWFLFLAGGMAALVLLAMMAVFFLRTDKGTIRVEINDPQVEVQIKGTRITLQGVQGAKEIRIEPGEHTLLVRRGDFEFETTRLVLRSGQRVTVRVEYVDGQLVVRRGNQELARARVPQPAPKEKPSPPPAAPAGPLDGLPQAEPAPPEGKKPTPPPEQSGKPSPEPAGSQPPVAVAPFGPKAARAYQLAWAQYLGVPVEKEVDLGDGVKMQFVLIPPGEFFMGCSRFEWDLTLKLWPRGAFRLRREVPLHRVRLTHPFYLARHEVTVQQFQKFVQETGYRTVAEQSGGIREWERGRMRHKPGVNWKTLAARPGEPVQAVHRQDVEAFCQWLAGKDGAGTFRLPSEAQWEFAARAGTNAPWYFGADPGQVHRWGNLLGDQDGFSALAPVGSFPPNPFGLHDMQGNVWELCSDFFESDFYARSPVADPLNRDDTGRWVSRGGGLGADVPVPAGCRLALRFMLIGQTGRLNVGFRPMLPLQDHRAAFPEKPPLPPECGLLRVRFQEVQAPVFVQGLGLLFRHDYPANRAILSRGKYTLVLGQDAAAEKQSIEVFPGRETVVAVVRESGKQVFRVEVRPMTASSDDQQGTSSPSAASIGSQPPVAVAPFGPKAARAYQEAWARYLGVPVEKEVDLGDGVKMQFVLIPPGEAFIGLSDFELDALRHRGVNPRLIRRERPYRRVRLTFPFYLARCETTVEQFAQFVKATRYQTKRERDKARESWQIQLQRQPGNTAVGFLNRDDSQAFCRWLGRRLGQPCRLPTEAEWEFAGRAGTTTLTYFGNDLSRASRWLSLESKPVGSYPPNPFGLCDMLGNLWEHCEDDAVINYHRYRREVNPLKVHRTHRTVLRGACYDLKELRVSFRHVGPTGGGQCGFRVAIPLTRLEAQFDDPPFFDPPPGCGAVQVELPANDPKLEVAFQHEGIVLTAEHKLRQVKLAAGPVRVVLRRGAKRWPCKEFSLSAGQRVVLHVEKTQDDKLQVRVGGQVLLSQPAR